MALRRRSIADRYSGTILDGAHGRILDPLPRASTGCDPLCCCRAPEKNRHGGIKPMVRWKRDGSGLEAYCSTCWRPLRSGHHKQRAATHALGLCKLPLEHVDLEDLVDAGMLLPEHLERPGGR